MRAKAKASFIEPMLLLRSDRLPDDSELWQYEFKLDGYRTIAFRRGGELFLRSRKDKDFSTRHREVARALVDLPNDTVLDGEIVALDSTGKPSFNLLRTVQVHRRPRCLSTCSVC